jgi:hypothetical protein
LENDEECCHQEQPMLIKASHRNTYESTALCIAMAKSASVYSRI